MRRPRLLWVAAGLLLVAGIGFLALRGSPAGEVIELLSEGGEKILREPLRANRSPSKVLVFALDGVGDDELRAALAVGSSQIQSLVGSATTPGLYEHAFAVDSVLSVLPSTTLAAWTSLFTGRPPGQTGVPGNEWFSRREMRFHAPAPVSIEETDEAVRVYSDNVMASAIRVPTLFERADVRSFVSLSQIHRGADLLTVPDGEALGDLLSAVVEGVSEEDDISQEAYEELDAESVESLVQTLRDRGVPDLQVVYFPGVDLYTHVAESPIEDQRDYIRDVIDPAIGVILGEYEAQGALESTYVLFVADHGHTPVLADDLHSLGSDGEDEPTAVISGAGFRMRPLALELQEDERDFQATVAYQGALAYVYLADRSTCPNPGDICEWSRGPRVQEDVIPVVRAFDMANRTGQGVPQLRGTMDLIFARSEPWNGADAAPFRIWNGETLVPIGDYLAGNPRPELLDLERRIRELSSGPFGDHAGDILLLARSGSELPVNERYYFSSEYRSWHGSPTAQDSHIPLILAHPSRSGSELRERVRAAVGERPDQVDVTALILNLLASAE